MYLCSFSFLAPVYSKLLCGLAVNVALKIKCLSSGSQELLNKYISPKYCFLLTVLVFDFPTSVDFMPHGLNLMFSLTRELVPPLRRMETSLHHLSLYHRGTIRQLGSTGPRYPQRYSPVMLPQGSCCRDHWIYLPY